MDKKIIDISTSVIIKVVAVILALWFLYLVRDVLALLFLSVILTATLDSSIDFMARHKIPRPLGVSIIYIILFLVVGLLISFLIPSLANQFKNFSENLPAYNETLAKTFGGITQYATSYGIQFNSQEFLQNITGGIFQSSNQIFATTIEVFSSFISILVVLSLTFYMSVKEDSMNKFLASITPKINREYVISVANRIKDKIGSWFAGQLLLMLIIFILDFSALSFFNVPYALVLALLAGLLEIVPYLGPIISTLLATCIGLLVSPVTGLIVLGVLTIIQQIESNILVPQLMKKAVGLNPIAVILALLIGAKLGGAMGAILSIPVATSLSVIIGDLVDKKEASEKSEDKKTEIEVQ
jgi:predicted PurR-regulated permease PerM